MARVPTDAIVPIGISSASPFTVGAIPVITVEDPPTLSASTLFEVTRALPAPRTGYELSGGGFFTDGGGAQGIDIISDPGGAGVYLTDNSGVGIYAETKEDSPGVFLISSGPASGGVTIVQESPSGLIDIYDRSTDGFGGIVLQTDAGDVQVMPTGRVVLDPSDVTRFGPPTGTPVAEAGAASFVFGDTYAILSPYIGTSFRAVIKDAAHIVRATSVPTLQISRVDTSLTAPTAVLNLENIAIVASGAYDGAAINTGALLRATATENWGAAAHGSSWSVLTIANGTTAQRVVATFGQDGKTSFTAPVAAGETVNITGFGGAGIPVIRINGATNGAAAAVGTLNNAPVAGNPAFWLPISIAGTVRYLPCW